MILIFGYFVNNHFGHSPHTIIVFGRILFTIALIPPTKSRLASKSVPIQFVVTATVECDGNPSKHHFQEDSPAKPAVGMIGTPNF